MVNEIQKVMKPYNRLIEDALEEYMNQADDDYQILLEADYLVNAGESEKYRKSWKAFQENVFRTKTGIRFLEAEMGAGMRKMGLP